MAAAPASIATLVGRFDAEVFDARRRLSRIRLAVGEKEVADAIVEHGRAVLDAPSSRPDTLLRADAHTWAKIAADARSGMDAFRSRPRDRGRPARVRRLRQADRRSLRRTLLRRGRRRPAGRARAGPRSPDRQQPGRTRGARGRPAAPGPRRVRRAPGSVAGLA